MKMIRGAYKDWEAIYCYANDCMLVVGISCGPRILHLSYLNGPNLLYEDHTDFRVGDWQLCGGHRFTIGPESARSYFPDNVPCEVTMEGGSLRVETPPTPEEISKSIRITSDISFSGFVIEHLLVNNSAVDWEGALWAITCILAAGSIRANITGDYVHIWPGTTDYLWKIDGDHIAVQPDGSRGKIGWYSKYAEIASISQGYEFSITAPAFTPASQCVDEGCNLELFFCNEYYELETLTGLVVLPPGQAACHVQHWKLAGISM